MSERAKIKIEADITPVERTVEWAERMLDALEEKRKKTVRAVVQTEMSVKSTFRHVYSLTGSFIRLLSDNVMPRMADAFIQSLVTIAETYMATSAMLATNPATAYLAISFAVMASMLHMVSVAKAELGFAAAQSQIDSARSILDEFGSML